MSVTKTCQHQTFGRSGLNTPPPTPRRCRDLDAYQTTSSPLRKRGQKNAITAAPTGHTASAQLKGRRRNGKRKQKKNREKRAAKKVASPIDTQPTDNKYEVELEEPATPPRRDLDERKNIPWWEPSPEVQCAPHAPSLVSEEQASTGDCREAETRGDTCIGYDEMMQGYETINSSGSEAESPVPIPINFDLDFFSDTKDPGTTRALSTPAPHDRGDATTALALLDAMKSEQTRLNEGSEDIEIQISCLRRTKFKINYAAIAKLEDELALNVGLSFDMFIEELAFRDLLEANHEATTFDFKGPLRSLAEKVEILIEKFEAAMEKLEGAVYEA